MDIDDQIGGKVMTVTFQLEGKEFVALNGGPEYKFSSPASTNP